MSLKLTQNVAKLIALHTEVSLKNRVRDFYLKAPFIIYVYLTLFFLSKPLICLIIFL